MNNTKAFHAPLNPKDTEKQTFGCRHTNPDICAKNGLPNVCGLVRVDKMCSAPPRTWPAQFKKLKTSSEKKK